MSYVLENELGKYMQSLQIHTEEENDKAIQHLLELTDRYEAGEPELEPIIEYITSQISAFEDEHYPIHDVSPVELLKHLMENHDHKQGDLTDVASRTVINEILNGKRELNLGHIRRLSEKYGVSPELFIN
jgi:HTH-type transcriptional regulator/antitoxin HigA